MLGWSFVQKGCHIVSIPSDNPRRESFEIGIAEIDLQHRQINNLLQRLKRSADKQYAYAASAILAELVMQTRIHFAVEESLMRLLSFPDTEAHVAEHRHLMEQLENFSKRAQDFDVADGLSDFIQTWLLDHIDNHDRKFVAHFLSKGIDPLAAPRPH